MKHIFYISAIFCSLLLSRCITQFVPETDEDQELIVVEGLITDQPEVYKVKVSLSMPLGKKSVIKPLRGCNVYITYGQNNMHLLNESGSSGIYVTDPAVFTGEIGRKYTLHINTNSSTINHYSYQSLPMEMYGVPPIDSLYYEKVTIKPKAERSGEWEGCQIYLNTGDTEGLCRNYRWDYTETWKFQLPYFVPNQTCWITCNSADIHVKSTSVLAVNRISRLPVKYISNESDMLAVRYSILVNQYSISEDEFSYWDKLRKISEEVGGLYDITPATIPGNIFCVEDPSEQVLGYFSVSAKNSKRIYIDEYFKGLVNLYSDCPSDTIYGSAPIPNLNTSAWIIVDEPYEMPPFKIITNRKGCADCTVRGTNVQPDFWVDY